MDPTIEQHEVVGLPAWVPGRSYPIALPTEQVKTAPILRSNPEFSNAAKISARIMVFVGKQRFQNATGASDGVGRSQAGVACRHQP